MALQPASFYYINHGSGPDLIQPWLIGGSSPLHGIMAGANGYDMGIVTMIGMTRWNIVGSSEVPQFTQPPGGISKFLGSGWLFPRPDPVVPAFPFMAMQGSEGPGISLIGTTSFPPAVTHYHTGFNAFDPSGNLVFRAQTAVPPFAPAAPIMHVMISWDVVAQIVEIVIDGLPLAVAGVPPPTWLSNNPVSARGQWGFQGLENAIMGDVWQAETNTYYSASDPAVRAKFVQGGLPVFLGLRGERPFGFITQLYFSLAGNRFLPKPKIITRTYWPMDKVAQGVR